MIQTRPKVNSAKVYATNLSLGNLVWSEGQEGRLVGLLGDPKG